MQNSDFPFHETLYSEHLATISGIKFTRREIDVIACLLNARGTSKIASFLSISLRTVVTHIRNIMLKLECNSREGIIDFIERSHKLPLLRDYYSSLVTEMAFVKGLREISKLKCEESSGYFIVYWEDQALKDRLLRHLANHLNQGGFKTEVRESNHDQKRELIENLDHLRLLLLEKREYLEISRKFTDVDSIDLSEHKNYYLSVLEVLKKLLPNINLEVIFTNFRKHTEGLQDSLKGSNSNVYTEEKSVDKYNYKILPKIIWIAKEKKWYFISAFFIISLGGIGVFTFKAGDRSTQYSKQYLINQVKKEDPPIRSDLVIPTDSSLLLRPEFISQIDNEFKNKNGIQTIALIGLGGAGKTTLARQYAHQRNDYVIWEVNAETHESIKSSFENLANALANTKEDKKILRDIMDIKNPELKEGKIIQFIRESFKLHQSWFLIFDNVEAFADIQKYFPQDAATWGEGKIILTTRDSHIQNNKYINNVILIGELSPNQKFDLFMKIMNHGNARYLTLAQTETAKTFLKYIPSFPLDVSIAACYIKTTNVPYIRYLESVKEYNKDFEDVQKNLLKEAGDYTKTRYGIITLALAHIINSHKDFLDLLLFISLLDSQNIPKDLLDKYKTSSVVDNFIYTLKKYSLITNESSSPVGPAFSIHRSTQGISLAYLIKQYSLDKKHPLFQSISNTLENYLNLIIKNEDFLLIEILTGHCNMFLSHKDLLSDQIKGAISSTLGTSYYLLGNYTKANNYLAESIKKLNINKSENHNRIAESFRYLGQVFREIGDFENAKRSFEQTLIIYKAHFSKNHIGLARASQYLGNVFSEQGRYEDAKRLMEQSLKTYQDYYPEHHADIAESLVCLSYGNRERGRYREAKDLVEQSIAIYRMHFPINHLETAWALGHLGNIYRDCGYYEKAKDLYEQCFIIHKKHLSQTHRRFAWALANLANIYGELGNYEKAKKLLEQSIIIYKKNFSEEHWRIAITKGYLACVHRKLGNYEKAKNLLKNSLRIYEKHFGVNHVETARGQNNLGQVYLLEGNLESAENLISRSLSIFLHNKHPESYKPLESLAEIYLKKSINEMNKGDLQQSQTFKTQTISYLEQALQVVKAHFPKDSPHIARIETKLKKLEK